MKNPVKILVLGSNGQLGCELQFLSEVQEENVEFIFATRSEIDLTEIHKLPSLIESIQPNIILNAAAYTAVDLAEKEQELAKAINTLAPIEIAKICKEKGIKFVHISTDFVFDGLKSSPYLEQDTKNPLGVYGLTKSLGEDGIILENQDALIIRTSWVFSGHGKNFFTTIVRLASERDELKIVDDQIGSPTWARDLAWFSFYASLSEARGVYHFTNEGLASWYDLAKAIVDSMGIECDVLPIPTKDYPTPAKRPSYSVLSKEKTRSTFGSSNNHWRDSVQALADELLMAEEMEDEE